MSAQLSRIKIHHQVWPVGESENRLYTNKNLKNITFYPFAQNPLWMDLYRIWFRGLLLYVINCATFLVNQFRGLD